MWVFNGEDPEKLFGANEDTSWYTWSQLGPEANDLVKEAVAGYLAPTEGKLHGKEIRNTQANSKTLMGSQINAESYQRRRNMCPAWLARYLSHQIHLVMIRSNTPRDISSAPTSRM